MNIKIILFLLVCDMPPEYCSADKKDFTECFNWLQTNHPDLFAKIYNRDTCKVWMEKTHPKMFV
jgi:hypothetical protein